MSTLNITVVQNTMKAATGPSGKPYKVCEIAAKNHSFQDKLEEFKVNSYSKVFKDACEMQAGQTYEVTREKNDAGYWNWVSVKQSVPGAAPSTKTSASPTAMKSTYETPEERAARQILIVKQSCLAQAVAYYAYQAEPASEDKVLGTAKRFAAWVFATMPDFEDIPDDIPVV